MPTTFNDLLKPGHATDFFARAPFPPFDPQATAYSPINALWLAELSRLVYRRDTGESDPLLPSRREFLERAGLDEKQFFNSTQTDTQAILVAGPIFAALVFRGTEDPHDFYQDLLAVKTRLGDGASAVHEGFESALESVWSKVEEAIRGVSVPIYFTGHSLGAALATLAASRVRPTALYTFGSPRVGNPAFVESLSGVQTFRVVDRSDLVTAVPPDFLNYGHVGQAMLLTGSTADDGTFDRFPGAKRLAEHAPINYVDRIAETLV